MIETVTAASKSGEDTKKDIQRESKNPSSSPNNNILSPHPLNKKLRARRPELEIKRSKTPGVLLKI